MAGSASSLAGVILAAGRGSRMGTAGKMLAPLAGRPMLAHVVDAARAAGLAPLIVVTGHDAEAVKAALAGRSVTIVHNPRSTEGMSTSLRAGLETLPPETAGAMVLLGDMPGVKPEHLERLAEAFFLHDGKAIIAPTCQERRGNPVAWPRSLFGALSRVEGDQGGRAVLSRHADMLVAVPMDSCTDGGIGVLRDIDTPEDLEAWKNESGLRDSG